MQVFRVNFLYNLSRSLGQLKGLCQTHLKQSSSEYTYKGCFCQKNKCIVLSVEISPAAAGSRVTCATGSGFRTISYNLTRGNLLPFKGIIANSDENAKLTEISSVLSVPSMAIFRALVPS